MQGSYTIIWPSVLAKSIVWDKEKHCVMKKGSLLQKRIIFVNMYVMRFRASNHMKQTIERYKQSRI